MRDLTLGHSLSLSKIIFLKFCCILFQLFWGYRYEVKISARWQPQASYYSRKSVVSARILKLRRRRETWAGGRGGISCPRQAQAQSARDSHHGLSGPYRPDRQGWIPCRYSGLRSKDWWQDWPFAPICSGGAGVGWAPSPPPFVPTGRAVLWIRTHSVPIRIQILFLMVNQIRIRLRSRRGSKKGPS